MGKYTQPNDVTSKNACGQRLKALRALTGDDEHKPLSRAAIERKYQLSASTLRHWEDAGGLTEKGARIVIDIYQRENITCSISWLLTGKGTPPYRRAVSHSAEVLRNVTDTLVSIPQESAHFKSFYPEAIVFEVKDDAMAPMYYPGDTVGGVRHYFKDIPYLIGKDCLTETKDGKIWLRRLQRCTIPGHYNLYALNPDTKIERPTLYNVEVVTCAPVMRVWRGKKW